MIKKIFLFGLLAFFAAPVFADTSISMIPAQHEAHIGEVVTVDVFMNADEPVNAVAAHVIYDPEFFDLISYRRTSEKVSFWIENQDDPYNGSVRFEGLLIDKGWQGNQEKLARLIFRVKKEGMSNIGIEQAALHAYDGTGENIIERVGHSDIKIISAPIRKEYKYTGTSDAEETIATDILYDDDYSRERELYYVWPWWVWIVLGISLLLFLWTLYLSFQIKKRTK